VITWRHLLANASYEVWRSSRPYFDPSNPASGAVILATVPAPTSDTTVSHTDASVVPTDDYFYAVLGINYAGTPSAPSNYVGIVHFALP
jgi:hypothetical protein